MIKFRVWEPWMTILLLNMTILLTSDVFFSFDFDGGNWQQADAWNSVIVGTIEVNALAQGPLWWFDSWPWIEHPTFQLRGIHFCHWATTVFAKKVTWASGSSPLWSRYTSGWICRWAPPKKILDPPMVLLFAKHLGKRCSKVTELKI